MSDNNFEKILFRCFSNDLQEIVVEMLWAECIDRERGLYKLYNIPFYDLPCSYYDIIFAEYDNDEERITFRKVVEPSGNSTILVIVNDENIKEELREEFRKLDCYSEDYESQFSLNIPFEVNYKPIYDRLMELENQELVYFAESNISEKHFSEKEKTRE